MPVVGGAGVASFDGAFGVCCFWLSLVIPDAFCFGGNEKETDRQTEGWRGEREREREREREEREREREREADRDRQTQTETDRQRDRDRQTEREIESDRQTDG